MKKFIGIALFCSGLFFACGGEAPTQELQTDNYRCELDNSICEHVATRSGSFYSGWFALRDCSWDYGVCIGKHGETNCEEWCANEAWIPSECQYGCEAYGPPQTHTSTTGE